mgnify:CR=1 FL=1
MNLTGKVTLVTGASRGIGRQIALTLAGYGATVIVNYNGSAAKAEEVVNEITANGGMAESMQCSVSDFEKSKEMIDGIVKKYGRLDILVNNAGITKDNLIMKMSEDDFDAVIDAYPHIKYERVCGNCDWYSNYPDKMEIEFAGKRIFFSHGHPYNVKFGYENIIAEAKRRNADIVLFGHTHNQYTEYIDGLYIMNPGSVGMNGDYGVIDITSKGDIMLIEEHI